MTTQFQVNAQLNGQEDLTSVSPLAGANGRTVKFTELNVSQTITASTTPNVDSPPADLSKTLASATETLDLTAIPLARDTSQTQDLTGKKLVAIHIKADPANNAAGILVEPGATNGYNLFGDSAGAVRLFPGQTVLYSFVDDANLLDAVAAGDRTIDLTGTVADAIEAIGFFGT